MTRKLPKTPGIALLTCNRIELCPYKNMIEECQEHAFIFVLVTLQLMKNADFYESFAFIGQKWQHNPKYTL